MGWRHNTVLLSVHSLWWIDWDTRRGDIAVRLAVEANLTLFYHT